jgi:hypothetical protein
MIAAVIYVYKDGTRERVRFSSPAAARFAALLANLPGVNGEHHYRAAFVERHRR